MNEIKQFEANGLTCLAVKVPEDAFKTFSMIETIQKLLFDFRSKNKKEPGFILMNEMGYQLLNNDFQYWFATNLTEPMFDGIKIIRSNDIKKCIAI